jgi:hypothetical protein
MGARAASALGRNFAETADLVQEALFQTFRRIDRLKIAARGRCRRICGAVTNRIRDETASAVR